MLALCFSQSLGCPLQVRLLSFTGGCCVCLEAVRLDWVFRVWVIIGVLSVVDVPGLQGTTYTLTLFGRIVFLLNVLTVPFGGVQVEWLFTHLQVTVLYLIFVRSFSFNPSPTLLRECELSSRNYFWSPHRLGRSEELGFQMLDEGKWCWAGWSPGEGPQRIRGKDDLGRCRDPDADTVVMEGFSLSDVPEDRNS